MFFSDQRRGMPEPAVSRAASPRLPAIAAVLAMLLSACSTTQGLLPGMPDPVLSAPTVPVQGSPLPGSVAQGSQIGTGPVKVALLLPLSGASTVVGTSLRNGAELALQESGGSDITILVKDEGDVSSPAATRAATQAALSEGAELIIGPLFAPHVQEAGRQARSANRPVIGFSTDTSSAARGIYLLSFLAESYVDRIVDFAAARGKKSFAALVPENPYGNVALAEFQQAAARRGVRVQSIERYQPGGAGEAVKRIAAVGDQIDALFIPEQADAMAAVSVALAGSNVDLRKIQVLGTGLWNDARVMKLPMLQGAWFAAPENGGFNAFAQRYRAKFGSDPTRIATLSYDAVSLVAALARTQGTQRFSESVLTGSSGFNGADGVFRFRPDGQNERGLAVLQIANGTTKSISPAPRSFGQATAAN